MEDRPQLSRTLKPQWIWAIALGSAVGWGSFVLPVDWMSAAGPLGAVLGLSIGGLLIIVIAVSYGFLVRQFPVSGGEFAYTYVGFGRTHAFLCAWFLALTYISTVALNASALALAAKFVLPWVAERGLMYTVAGWDVYFAEVVIASLAIVLVGWLNIRGATLSGKAQFIMCIVMIVGVVLITLGAFLHPSSSVANITPVFTPEIPALTAILTIVAIAPWAYAGFDNVPQAAEEFDFSAGKAFGLIVMAILAAIAIYSALIFATATATPWQELVAAEPVWGTGEAIPGLFGIFGLVVLVIALCMGIFTGLNGFSVSASRLVFALGRGRVLPSVFGKLHPTHRTPYAGIIFTVAVCLIAPWFGREVLLWIVGMTATGISIAYIYTCLVAFKLFRWSSDRATPSSSNTAQGTVAPMRKAVSLLGAIIAVGFLALLVIPFSPGFLAVQSWIALIVWALLGVAFYLYKQRDYGRMHKSQLDYLILGEEADSNKMQDPEKSRTE